MTQSPANAGGLWDMVKNASSDGEIQTKQYTVEVSGTDIRGYVYEVPEMKSFCWSTFTQNAHQTTCKTYKEMGLKEQ